MKCDTVPCGQLYYSTIKFFMMTEMMRKYDQNKKNNHNDIYSAVRLRRRRHAWVC